jgi:GT2 family glycosyltransferase/ubiquinone/menaquinone biosynthesis C-methylase UbiE/glycosyltransferase involved in cell wall biosynthesis
MKTEGQPPSSSDWWQHYFENQYAEKRDGKQARHFMECLLGNLPVQVIAFLRSRPLRILDWGCEFGEGVAVIANALPESHVVGLEHAWNVLKEARQRYRDREFVLAEEAEIPGEFDVIVTSNRLQCFEYPLEKVRAHLRSCRSLYLALVPYNQARLSEYHRSQFREESFPERLEGFIRLCARPVDVDPGYWNGRQLLVVYASPSYVREQSAAAVNIMERKKWDRYYESLPPADAPDATRKFHDELASRVSDLLTRGDKVLEAGCGAGWQSLAIARLAKFKLSLMDYSEGALSNARLLFDRERISAEFIHGDVLRPGKPEFDLVFNAGVLEHYTFEQQVAFLRGMASRSRKFVLTLVPNRLCYWYWLWRIQKSADGNWPFGKEVPLIDLSTAYKAAGLHFLGQTFMGEDWTEIFISGLPGMNETLRESILAVHRSPLISMGQKSYLIAALGSVIEVSEIPAVWTSPSLSENLQIAELNASLADSLASTVAAKAHLAKLEGQAATTERALIRLCTGLSEGRPTVAALQPRMEEQEVLIETPTAKAAANAQLIEILEAQIGKGERAVESLSSEMAKEAEKVTRLTSELQAKELEAYSLSKHVAALEHELQELTAKQLEGRNSIDFLRAQLAGLQEENERLSAQAGEKERLVQTLETQASERQGLVRELLSRLEREQQEVVVLLKQMSRKERTISRLSARLVSQEQHASDLETLIAERERDRIQTLAAKLTAQEEAVRWQSAQVEERDKVIRARDEAIAWLQEELAKARKSFAHKAGCRLRRVAVAVRHPIQWLELKRSYWQLRSLVRQALVRILPTRWARNIVYLFRYWGTLPPSAPAPSKASEPLPAGLDQSDKVGGLKSLSISPGLSLAELDAAFRTFEDNTPQTRPDVICFSIIDWDFRYQRPQQIMSQFAAHGHRVFYISTTRYLPPDSASRVVVTAVKGNVYEVSLAAERPPDVYGEIIDGGNKEALLVSLQELRRTYHIEEAIGYVMIPSWSKLALEARRLWGWNVIYDCMDQWENFPGIGRVVVEMQIQLVKECDLLVVTAQKLYQRWREFNRPMVLARNAVDYDYYSQECRPNGLLEKFPHPIIGYYGAIAEWFDLDLMAYVARRRLEYAFVFIGGVFNVDISGLEKLPNVHFLGQQPYETMPLYLYHFDVCLIPFKVNAITEATDPVKLYEYLSAGKPVVSAALSELEHYRENLYIARGNEDFLTKLDQAVCEVPGDGVSQRITVAKQNTWGDRYKAIEAGLRGVVPRASIIVITYNKLPFTRLCLESILRNTGYLNYEVIVADNKSTDGTQEYLQEMAGRCPNVSIILNPNNGGFAKANNQGIAKSTGEWIVLLNNDTIVPPGWLSRLVRHLNNPSIGLVGPLTNFVGNEAKVEADYQTWAQMEEFSRRSMALHEGQLADIQMLAMFCVAFRRTTYDAVGPLDEKFGTGTFEDDDYSLRVRRKGLRVVCAGDVFVHHFGLASFKELISSGEYDALFEKNRRYFESKWQVQWVRHRNVPLRFEGH